jgi:hypothetical protein
MRRCTLRKASLVSPLQLCSFIGHDVFPYTIPYNNLILCIKQNISSIYITLLDGITIPLNLSR